MKITEAWEDTKDIFTDILFDKFTPWSVLFSIALGVLAWFVAGGGLIRVTFEFPDKKAVVETRVVEDSDTVSAGKSQK